MIPLDEEGDNAALVPTDARLPAPTAVLEWDYDFSPGVGRRGDLELARRIAHDSIITPREPRLVGRPVVDDVKAYRFALGGFRITVVFYGNFIHTSVCQTRGEGATPREMAAACRRVERGASLAW